MDCTRKEKEGAGEVVELRFAMRPESWPPERATQGWSKVDWVTEWFPAVKEKRRVSPTFAETVLGVKTGSEAAEICGSLAIA